MSSGAQATITQIDSREDVLKRDCYRCRLCGRLGKEQNGPAHLEAHHSPSNRNSGSTSPQTRITLCRRCHRHHHNLPDPSNVDFESAGVDPAPGDHLILSAFNRIGKSKVSELAAEAGLSEVYTYQRVYNLAAAEVIAPLPGGYWNLADDVDETTVGTLPDNPKAAVRLARDEMMRRMRLYGLTDQEIAEISGLSRRSVRIAIDRAKALKPPVPPTCMDD